MSVDDAKKKLAAMREEMKNLRGEGPAEREYRSYLQVQIDSYANAIEKFESDKTD
jgi:hypothetical protein